MKILILGCNGMLGLALQTQLEKKCELIGIDKVLNNKTNLKFYQLDLLKFTEVVQIVLEEKPDVIINVAAIVNLNICEENKEIAKLLHYKLSEKISLISKKLGCKYVYISTDSVFDGNSGGYTEESLTNPLNYYAKSKLEGEEIIRNILENYIIIRTNIYGYSENQNSLLKWAYNSLKENSEIVGYTNVTFNPVSVTQLAEIIEKLLKENYKGTVNIGSNKVISKFEFIEIIAKYLNKEKFLKKGVLDDSNSKIKRPKNTSLVLREMKRVIAKEYELEKEILRIIREVENENRK